MSSKKNIIFILTDQQRLSTIGAYGLTPCETPNINRLAREGVRFDVAYTSTPICSPARGSIMTGLYPHSHGITANCGELGCTMHNLPDNSNILSRKLGAIDYNLGLSGKWHLCPLNDEIFGHSGYHSFLPKKFGFQGQNIPGLADDVPDSQDFKRYLQENNYNYEVKPWSEKTVMIRSSGELVGSEEATIPYFVTENTIEMIDQFKDKEQPFFIWHNFWGPHEPYFVVKEYLDRYRGVEIPPWPNYDWPARNIIGPHHVKLTSRQECLTWEDWKMMVRYYYAATTMMDNQIGRILHHLEESHLLEETIIVFASDHGETLGSHGGLFDKGWHHFEETHRIPLIIRFPDGSYAGEVRDEFVSLLDIYPTILDIAGAPYDESMIHGQSLIPLIENRNPSWRDYIVVEFGGVNNTGTTQRTLRRGNLKFGFNIAHEDELYDLGIDPYETRNLIHHPAYSQELMELRVLLAEWMEQTGDAALFRYKHQLRYHQSVQYPN